MTIMQDGHRVREVILHTSATPGDWRKGKTVEQMRDESDRWHKGNGWKGIGYHRVIAPDGSMAVGRSLYDMGAHVAGHNAGTIGICLIPSATHNGITRFEDYFTDAQRASLKAYLVELQELAGGDIQKITGHNAYANKECPGFKVRSGDWL